MNENCRKTIQNIGSGKVGDPCTKNTDCIDGSAGFMYCNVGQCACSMNAVTVNDHCYESKS